MRFMLILIITLASLFACTSTGTITPQSVVDEIRKDCGIVVTVADIAALITSQPALTTIAAFAKEVCDAFKAQHAAPTGSGAGGIVIVNGVTIHYTIQ